MSAMDIAVTVLLFAGLFFLLVGGIGLVRFPGFFLRLHPAGKADTLGVALMLLGLALHLGFTLLALKLLLVNVFILLANPAGTHAVGRAALKSGLRPWTHDDEGDAA